MNAINPYSAPETQLHADPESTGKLQGLPFDQLKKLYYRSRNVKSITSLVGLCAVALGVFGLLLPDSVDKLGFSGLAVLNALLAVGLYRRAVWGRFFGAAVCVLVFLLAFLFAAGNAPLVPKPALICSVVIAGGGLFAFLGSPELFGVNRVTHSELKDEFEAR